MHHFEEFNHFYQTGKEKNTSFCLTLNMSLTLSLSVGILKRNVAMETVQNRAARALGNLAMDPESSALIHSAGNDLSDAP